MKTHTELLGWTSAVISSARGCLHTGHHKVSSWCAEWLWEPLKMRGSDSKISVTFGLTAASEVCQWPECSSHWSFAGDAVKYKYTQLNLIVCWSPLPWGFTVQKWEQWWQQGTVQNVPLGNNPHFNYLLENIGAWKYRGVSQLFYFSMLYLNGIF